MIHSVAFTLGYLLMILCGMASGALLVLGAAKLFNRAMWALVDCYGGVKTFDEFRRWHWADKPSNDATLKDAKRYRWLLANYARGDGYDAIDAALNDGEADIQLSPAVDAAMTESRT